jgi:hypothetical protein
LGRSHVGHWQRGRIFLVSVVNNIHSLFLFVFNQDSGGINMPSLLPFLGHTELEVLSVIGVILLIGTHLATVASVKERVLLTSGYAQVLSSTRRKLIHAIVSDKRRNLSSKN